MYINLCTTFYLRLVVKAHAFTIFNVYFLYLDWIALRHTIENHTRNFSINIVGNVVASDLFSMFSVFLLQLDVDIEWMRYTMFERYVVDGAKCGCGEFCVNLTQFGYNYTYFVYCGWL